MRQRWATPEERAAVIGTRVGGEGKSPSRLMCLGEFPGVDEGLSQRPFVGRSGREFMRFLNGYELPQRGDLYLSNLSKTVAKDGKGFTFTTEDEVALWDEIERVRPSVIATLGMHSTRYFLGDVTLEAVHGIPHKPVAVAERLAMRGLSPIILPCYNPAAALYSPNLQAVFAQDMQYLGLYLKGKLTPPPVDEKPGSYDVLPPGTWTALPPLIAVDTEGWWDRPWCISWSGRAYQGQVVRHGGHEQFVNSIRHRPNGPPRLVIHNSLHDLDVLDRGFGCPLDEWDIAYDDTMVMAYLLGLEPQGLKPLAYRHAGMEQDDYADLVADVAEGNAFLWLHALMQLLPEKAIKLTTKRDKKALNLDPEIEWWMTPDGAVAVLDPDREELGHARNLIERMLTKSDAKDGLVKRWAGCTARDLLVEERGFLPSLAVDSTDPPEPTLDEIPLTKAVTYAARDADCTIRVYPRLKAQITAMGLDDVYAVDMATVPMFARMQRVGLKADVEHFRSLSLLFEIEAAENADAIVRTVGRPINPNSGDQVAALLFDDLKIQHEVANLRLKKTKSGQRFTTNDKVLDALKGLHPVVELIQEGREIRKLKGTYADPMPDLIGADGRLHPNYRITRTDTGRPAANKPNVLALPKHSTRGKLIRQGFIAEDGHELGEWDLAQIEMCVFAHDSADERMIAEILSGIDKHAATASNIFGRPAKTIYEEYQGKQAPGDHQRFAAKAVNFGILMGITGFGLLDQFHKNGQLDWTLDRTEELLRDWLKAYPGGSAYIARKHTEARRHGFVRDMFGRLRWLEGIHSDDDYIRAEAERMAQATPVQSGAQGIIKRAMRDVWPVLKALRGSFWCEPLLQVHDALVNEYDLRERAMVDGIMRAAMANAVTLRVPVKVSANFGQRLGDL